MLGYWAAASVASLAVVMLIRWPETAFSLPVLRSLGAVIGMMLLAVWALLRYLPIGPLRLIQETMEAFRR
jgi:hypothetical protein